MNMNKIVKITYHTYALLIILLVAILYITHPYYTNKKINLFIFISLLLIVIFHAYDVWWFYKHDGPAPI
jgi:hypothetical protein